MDCPTHQHCILYTTEHQHPKLAALFEEPDSNLKAAALLEQQQLTKSNLQSEEEFLKAHGGREKVYDAFKDPYSEDEKKILLENYCREPATRRALDILTEFTLGERTELSHGYIAGLC